MSSVIFFQPASRASGVSPGEPTAGVGSAVLLLPTRSSFSGSTRGGISSGMRRDAVRYDHHAGGSVKERRLPQPHVAAAEPERARSKNLHVDLIRPRRFATGPAFATRVVAHVPEHTRGRPAVYPLRGNLHRERELPRGDPQVRVGPSVARVFRENLVLQSAWAPPRV